MADLLSRQTRSNRRRHAGRWTLIALGLVIGNSLFAAGCSTHATTDRSGAHEETLRQYYVVKHGWHVGLVVAHGDLANRITALAEDFPGVRYLEIGWGDARYYQTPDPSMALALRAALWPTDSVLHVVGFSGSPARVFPASEIIPICVGASAYDRLLDFIAEAFHRGPSGDIERLGVGLYGNSRFYRARGSFHAFRNCNTWAARAAAASGIPMATRTTFTAGGVVSQLRRATQDTFPCP